MGYVLVGNYGVGNFGDEALKEYFLSAFPEIEWHVASARPQTGELPRLPAGPRSLFFTPWWKTLIRLIRSEGMVFGGGTLFTDTESWYACFLWWCHAFTCWLFRRRYFLAFQGVGPFRTGVGEMLARWTVRHASFLSVRDEASLIRVKAWNMNIKIVQTFDPVYSLMKAKNISQSTNNVFIIIPRNNSGATFQEKALKHAALLAGEEKRILSLQPDDVDEQAVCGNLARVIGAVIVPIRSNDDLLKETACASLVLAERYHGALAAHALGKHLEIVFQGEGDKLMAFPRNERAETLQELVRVGERELRASLLD